MKTANSHCCTLFVRRSIVLPSILLLGSVLTPSLHGQSLLPGATLPVRLQSTLNSEKDHPGKTFTVKTTQDISVKGYPVIRKGATITGNIVVAQSIKTGDNG